MTKQETTEAIGVLLDDLIPNVSLRTAANVVTRLQDIEASTGDDLIGKVFGGDVALIKTVNAAVTRALDDAIALPLGFTNLGGPRGIQFQQAEQEELK